MFEQQRPSFPQRANKEHDVVNTIETTRLILRPWRADDLEELGRLFADPAVRKGRHLPPERIMVIAESSLRQWQRNEFGPWAARDRATGQWIGRVGLAALRFGFGEHQLERIGLEEQSVRQWKGIEVVWYALDRSVWEARGRR